MQKTPLDHDIQPATIQGGVSASHGTGGWATQGVDPGGAQIDIDPEQSFRNQLDIDSMDFLHLVTAGHKQLGVPIPELDYPRLASLDGAVHCVLAKLPDLSSNSPNLAQGRPQAGSIYRRQRAGPLSPTVFNAAG